MKEKGVTKIALILLVLVCVFAIVACSDNVNTDGDVCKHIYTEKADATYLKSAATCTEKAVYYKSCSLCGEKDTATFEYGEALGHEYGDGVSNGDGTHTRTCANDATHKIIENCSGGTATCTERATCEICNASYGDVEHKYSSEWSYNSTYHWKVVTCGCDVEQNYVNHTLDDDGKCTVCGQQIVGTEGVVYVSYDTYAVVTGYIGTESDVKIAAFYKDLPVISIENNAFSGCSSLTSVTIPESVTSIGEHAFWDCTSLTSVTIGNKVTSIGDLAFQYCYKLIEVRNTSTLNITAGSSDYGYVGYYAKRVYAEGKSYLSTDKDGYIIYDDGTDKILVSYTGKETDLTLPSSITQINGYAFYNCTSLKSVTIGNNVTSIGKSAFYNCTSLTTVTIGNNVTSIGKSAFYNCTSLTSVTIPDSVTSIGYGAFRDCSSLTSVTIPDSVTSIGNYAFSRCTALTSVTIGNNVTSIGKSAFSGCESLTSVNITDIAAWCNISFGDSYANPLYYAKNLYLNNNLVTALTIPDGVTSIGNYAFYYCTSLTSVTIGNNVKSIGYEAFRYCWSLTSVTIPDSVTSIGGWAFYGCESLTSVNITDIAAWCNISFGGSYANPLYYAKNLYLNNNLVTALTIPDSVTSIGNYAFYSCRSLTSVTIGNGVTSIGDYAFSGCASLTSVTIGNNVTSIGKSAFSGCESLTSVNITDIAAWCKISFGKSEPPERYLYCSNPLYYAKNLYLNNNLVTALTIPDGVTSINSGAFYNCTSLTTVTIGNNVTSIGEYAFSDCSSLTSVTIPDRVTSIGNYAFYNCTSLTTVTIGNNVTSIGNYAFSNCSSLTSVTIPDSVTSINSGAFRYCSSLTSVTIGNGVTSIGNYAFFDCTSLKTVYYKGTAADWRKIIIGNNNSYITNTKRYYYSESKPKGSGNYWHYVDGKPTVWVSDEEN